MELGLKIIFNAMQVVDMSLVAVATLQRRVLKWVMN
jgi:hypothetical protein